MENKTLDTVQDCCGSFMEIGTVIAEEDNVLVLPIASTDQVSAQAQFDAIAANAKQRFSDVQIASEWEQDAQRLTGRLSFSCAAERLIFEMALG
ncbi:DUF406 family protein [Ferrimonas pelagia]|uniref:YfcZ/YiiS family protein n=1 Tax=Ferrimonas pelagia TaxID=1177826 RepID=A0ABP9EDK0_9GAMM